MHPTDASNAYGIEQQKILRNYFADLLEVAAESRVNIGLEALLKAQGLSAASILNGSTKLSFDAYYRLLGAIHETGAIPGLGLRLGARKSATKLGIYGYAALSSPTFEHFGWVARRIFRAIYDVLDLSMPVERGQVIFRYDTLLPARVGFVPLMEQVVSTGVALISNLLPAEQGWNGCEARFAFPKPEYARMYSTYIPCQIRFNQDATEVRVPESWLSIPLSSGDEVMASVCESQFTRMLDGLNASGSLADRVRRLLVYSSSNSVPKLGEVAARCHVAERTLRHHLAAEGVSFRELVNDVRLTLAKRYLSDTDLSPQEIAYLLGYSQVQNFYRAFGKAVGRTPEGFRRQSAVPVPDEAAGG